MSKDTLYNEKGFIQSAPPWFDGFFDWEWILQCFEGTNITPTDFDAVVERKRHYLIIETKKPGIVIPQGQLWALERLNQAKSFTILKCWGKHTPNDWEGQVRYTNGKILKPRNGTGVNSLIDFCLNWFTWADSQGR